MSSSLISIACEAFGVTPDSRFLYLGSSHRKALASLIYGIDTERGFLVLTGSPGSGKTTLLFHLMQHYQGTAETAFVYQTQCTATELLRYVLTDCGINADGADFLQMQALFNEHALKINETGKQLLVFVDEAHNLGESVLETVRLLSDFEKPNQKLFQLVLSGHQHILSTLSRPGLLQLRQRVSVFARVEAFSRAEVAYYIRHRLHCVGADDRQVITLFSPKAFKAIAEVTGGNPREINNVCFAALSLADTNGVGHVTPDIVHAVAAELRLTDAKDRVPLVSEEATLAPQCIEVGSAESSPPMQEESLPIFERMPTQSKNPPTMPLQSVSTDGGDTPPDPFALDSYLPASLPPARPTMERMEVAASDDDNSPDLTGTRREKTTKKTVANRQAHVSRLLGVTGVLVVLIMTLGLYRSGWILHKNVNLKAAFVSFLPTSTVTTEAHSTSASGAITQDANGLATKVSPPKLSNRRDAAVKSRPTQRQSLQPASSGKIAKHSIGAILYAPKPYSGDGSVTSEGELISSQRTQAGESASSSSKETSPARLIEKQPALYPREALRKGIEGDVLLNATITKDGHLKDITFVDGNPVLAEAAITAAERWRYRPHLVNFQPVEVKTEIRFSFKR